jgi:hypothetical protein
MEGINRIDLKRGLGLPKCRACGKTLRDKDREIVQDGSGRPLIRIVCTNPRCKDFNNVKEYVLSNGGF